MNTIKATRSLIATATVAAIIALGACSTSPPATTTASKPAATGSSAPAGAPNANPGSGCQVNPATAPMPTADPYEPVPEAGRISVTLSGIPSGTVKPGSAPTEVDVTLCNNSQVSYPKVGLVLVLTGSQTRGTVESFDPATGGWTQLEHPVEGPMDMEFFNHWTNVQELPKGKAVTLRYRITLDASMTDGKDGVQAIAVLPEKPPTLLGKADLPFTVSTGPEPNGPAPTPAPTPAPGQTVLPFTGLNSPLVVALDSAGNVYVANRDRVLKLAAGSNTQTVLPATGAKFLDGLAVDAAGNVYVIDNNRVVKLAAGSNAQTVLPVTGLKHPQAVAVDAAGNVYVADNGNVIDVANGTTDVVVVKLAAGSNTQTVLPFTGLQYTRDVAVDSAGNVYVVDDDRVLKLAAGSNTQTVLPVTGISGVASVAVDAAGNVYVLGDNRVVKLAAGSNTQTVLPVTGLSAVYSLTVDAAGNVYVLDGNGFGQVVKLAAG
jgi:sugar lactone lactonase YvrE